MSSTIGALPLLVLVFLIINTEAKDGDIKCSSHEWCGKHNIRHPFRLQDSPHHCGGDHRYTLSCEHDDQLILYWKSGKFRVHSINYNNYTIRLVHASLAQNSSSSSASFPPYSLSSYNFSIYKREPYQYEYFYREIFNVVKLMRQMLYLRCPYGVESGGDVYVDESAATSSMKGFLYVNVSGKSLRDLGLRDSCRIEWMYPTSCPAAQNYYNNHTNIHNTLLYGFELSWAISSCKHYYFYTRVLIDDHNNIRCIDFGAWLGAIIPFDIIVYYTLYKFMLGAPFLIVLCICKWRRRHLSIYDTIEDFLRSDNSIMPIRYSYKDIKSITGGFNTKLGNGGYGSVFQGKLRSGRLVAVKVLNKAKSNGQDFINEVATIGRIYHVNVVQLIGFCVEGSKRALIYELMQNGSLEKYIFSNEESLSLSCENLYRISLGVARGIEYLHNGCDMKILHFDIKPHNILLDENFNPKVSDFGLARLYPTDNSFVSLTAARGTIGYMAPELFYRNVGAISYKADVYSFGMLLMEIAGRRKNLNALNEHSSQIYYPFWVYDQLHNGKEIAIENDTDEETKLAKKMMIVALWCIQTRPSDRPSMAKVVEMLEQDDENLLQMPPKPYFYDPNDVAAAEDHVADHQNISSLSFEISVSESN